MSTCKYFLRGDCRYGDRCRFSHSMNNNQPAYHHGHHQQQQQQQQYHRHPRPQSNPRFSFVAAANAPRQSNVFQPVIQWARTNFRDSEHALDILQQLQKEARLWLKSASFWRFTSRSICPGGQPFPNWTDFSFEEVRWEYYMKKSQNQEHLYKKAYSDYWEANERQLVGLSRLNVDTLDIFKPYIEQSMQMNYHPEKTLITDVDMESSISVQNHQPTVRVTFGAHTATPAMSQEQPSNHYTPDDLLLEEERAAFKSDSFEFGKIPLQPPSMNFA